MKSVKERVIEAIKTGGKTSFQIGKEVGLSANRVRDIAGEIGVSLKKPAPEPMQNLEDRIVAMTNSAGMHAKPRVKTSGEALIIHLTDWHFGRYVLDGSGDVLYDIRIAKSRAKDLCEKILMLAKEHIAVGTNLTEVVIFMTGDMVDGEGIYDGQAFETDAHPPDQVMEFSETVINFVTELKNTLKVPIRIYCVRGNHGRSAAKGASPQTNWDSMAYKILAFWVSVTKQKNISVEYSSTEYLLAEVQGHKYLLRHKGVSHLESGMGGKSLGWGRLHTADALVCGHLHHFGFSEHIDFRLFMGGSLMGFEDFAESLGKGTKPSQNIWGCTKKHISTFVYIVDLN